MRGVSTEAAVRHDFDSGFPANLDSKIWLPDTTRRIHWEFVSLDESEITKRILIERGCLQTPTPGFHSIGISSFNCSDRVRDQNSSSRIIY